MKTTTVSLLCSLCLVSTGAYAQRTSATDSLHHIDSVSVTAPLRHEIGVNSLGVPAKKVPLTISTLSGATLSERAITQVTDAMRFVPAVQMKSSFGAIEVIATF